MYMKIQLDPPKTLAEDVWVVVVPGPLTGLRTYSLGGLPL